MNVESSNWPELNYAQGQTTLATVHRWIQIIGKIRLVHMPWINHSWHATFYITPTGLTTGFIPYENRAFQIDLNFLRHTLQITTSGAVSCILPLRAQSVASFYSELMDTLDSIGFVTEISATPNELPDATPFAEDHDHESYDRSYIENLQLALVQAQRVFTAFRAKFKGKSSPVHFFWGSFDLAVTRFSGRGAPEHPGGIPNLPDWITREAYSHEVSSAGFWPGGDMYPSPIFYSYAYPQPKGFEQAHIKPQWAFYSEEMREYILQYDDVRTSPDPDATLLEFLESTYQAAAQTGDWSQDLEFDWQRP